MCLLRRLKWDVWLTGLPEAGSMKSAQNPASWSISQMSVDALTNCTENNKQWLFHLIMLLLSWTLWSTSSLFIHLSNWSFPFSSTPPTSQKLSIFLYQLKSLSMFLHHKVLHCMVQICKIIKQAFISKILTTFRCYSFNRRNCNANYTGND